MTFSKGSLLWGKAMTALRLEHSRQGEGEAVEWAPILDLLELCGTWWDWGSREAQERSVLFFWEVTRQGKTFSSNLRLQSEGWAFVLSSIFGQKRRPEREGKSQTESDQLTRVIDLPAQCDSCWVETIEYFQRSLPGRIFFHSHCPLFWLFNTNGLKQF